MHTSVAHPTNNPHQRLSRLPALTFKRMLCVIAVRLGPRYLSGQYAPNSTLVGTRQQLACWMYQAASSSLSSSALRMRAARMSALLCTGRPHAHGPRGRKCKRLPQPLKAQRQTGTREQHPATEPLWNTRKASTLRSSAFCLRDSPLKAALREPSSPSSSLRNSSLSNQKMWR